MHINPSYKLSPIWYAHIDHTEIKRLNDSFLEKWLESHALHLTREPNALLKITFTPGNWLIEFVYKNDQFENHEQVELNPIAVSDQTVTAYFASKDWVPALKCLSDLPVTDAVIGSDADNDEVYENEVNDETGATLSHFTPEETANYKGGVWFELDDHVLRIEFCTLAFGGAQHTIYIPTVDEKGERSTEPFIRYKPEVTIDNSDNPAEADSQLETDWPEKAEIEP